MSDRATVPVPAEERCRCGRPMVMGRPCAHHDDRSTSDVVERATGLARSLRGEGQTDDAQLVGELVGALRHARATIEELRPLVSGVRFRQAGDRALRSSR